MIAMDINSPTEFLLSSSSSSSSSFLQKNDDISSSSNKRCSRSIIHPIYPRQNNIGRVSRHFGTKRNIEDIGGDSTTSSGSVSVPGSINIYNEQDIIPNINIEKLEQTIKTIRDIIGYATYDVNLLLVDDEYMRSTNLETRGIDKPTDILSFPMHDTALGGAKGAGLLEEPEFDIPEYYCLGDMMVDVPYVMRRCEEDRLYFEGEQQGSSGSDNKNNNENIVYEEIEDDEEYEEYEEYVGNDDRGVSGAMSRIYDTEKRINLLLVHGMLHLVGYDHIEDDDYEVMIKKEEEII
eukprot:CAMPEP_0203677842 /NCGR_PEP_ID=MMETSP0090-20130426/29772_1 /ASSEMBLY_ACC=CAM_ASM_001088 /TAXON_ID=426623 /ORGANISM="Chaetoceros affinis, Strain CCMP159" /LENGTH=292 /DNA_ID=CAMNT_0050544865 /DNA_START=207 /DNA_END=1082 /DNA_ORIENTATION=+